VSKKLKKVVSKSILEKNKVAAFQGSIELIPEGVQDQMLLMNQDDINNEYIAKSRCRGEVIKEDQKVNALVDQHTIL
jgi:hypothetical protein